MSTTKIESSFSMTHDLDGTGFTITFHGAGYASAVGAYNALVFDASLQLEQAMKAKDADSREFHMNFMRKTLNRAAGIDKALRAHRDAYYAALDAAYRMELEQKYGVVLA